MGCHKGHCVVNFYLIILVSSLIFHSKPYSPDWQIHCQIFLVVDYMLFLKAIFIINLHLLLILMHQSIIISLDSF